MTAAQLAAGLRLEMWLKVQSLRYDDGMTQREAAVASGYKLQAVERFWDLPPPPDPNIPRAKKSDPPREITMAWCSRELDRRLILDCLRNSKAWKASSESQRAARVPYSIGDHA